ncbi:hypothetical protein Q428_13625 [Fervidicella metallireducens AeB]|uniref:Peptidase M10 metallopeptidase domain-containing protein n=1 Tax=Fervidicella metallireducens AeB TaxID=1403537 RepID=A0A017RRV4_9CLOT|nr:hypothetical protein [Fervidicella metallireducens]EYE87377.1 hypothetical protein Q428_13625 [Fervidicella metallireducens AeB]
MVNSNFIDNEYSDIFERNRVYEFTICHEIGHCFGLADLGFFDTRNSVMSEYANKITTYQPTVNDINGVKASYDLN